ncbi:cupin domain-containing protein [Methylobacterium sp. CM6247]
MDDITRRIVLLGSTVSGLALTMSTASAATFGNPDAPPQGAVNTLDNPRSLAIPGPQNPILSGQFPTSVSPPATDVGSLPQFWASFNNAQRRIQNGGWARQVTQSTFPISTTIAGVDMRLAAGGIREMHWHQAAEWAFMTYGNCRITVLDPKGRAYVADIGEGDLWYFPAGYPHSLQGLGPDGAQFVLCFDEGNQSEYDTLLLNEWMAHTPPDVLALNFGVPSETFESIPLQDTYIFQGKLPGSLAADQAAVRAPSGPPPNPFTFSLASGPVTKETRGGTVQIADSHNFKASTTVAAALVTVKPGGMREMHWHPNADEWQYYIKGTGQMTVFKTGPNSVTTNFNPGDIGYIQKNFGHYIKNVGTGDLMFLEVFRTSEYQDISLSDWLSHTPKEMVSAHLNLPADMIAKLPRINAGVMPI